MPLHTKDWRAVRRLDGAREWLASAIHIGGEQSKGFAEERRGLKGLGRDAIVAVRDER